MKSSIRFMAAVVVLLISNLALAGSHTWRISEIYSNCDGTVQFIELLETCGTPGETGTGFHHVTSNTHDQQLTNVAAPSSNKRILLGTANLTSMGGPAPDFVIPANFFSLTGDLIRETGVGQMCTIASGAVPTNGTSSLNRPAVGCGNSTCPNTVAVNSPTNYAGQTGSVTATACVDGDGDGYGSPGHPCCSAGSQLDCNDAAPGIHPGAPEAACADSADNDCDGAMDCDDSDCTASCVPTMSQWGLMVVALLVLTGGTVISRRRLRPQS